MPQNAESKEQLRVQKIYEEHQAWQAKLYGDGQGGFPKLSTTETIHITPRYAESRSGYVYLLEAIGCGRFKIGRSRQLRQRTEQLRNQSPYPQRIVHVIQTDDIATTEKHWHQAFSDHRVHGEWLELTAQQVQEFVNAAQEAAK